MQHWSLSLPGGHKLRLHRLVPNDKDCCDHDHAFWVLMIVLSGGYVETRNGQDYDILPWRPWAPWRIYYRPLNFRHRIQLQSTRSWVLGWYGKPLTNWSFYPKTRSQGDPHAHRPT
jgi:hypothetical protein